MTENPFGSHVADFWPLVEHLMCGKVCEVGAEHGTTTRKILECNTVDFVHVVDAKPSRWLLQMLGDFEHRHHLYPSKSLEVLRLIEPCDVYILDGDHNYWTVSEELKAVYSVAPEATVLVHDVGWPFGRRDMYYYLEDIPAEHLNDYHREGHFGAVPGMAKLQKGRGWRCVLSRGGIAWMEGGPRNGVLTAVEDFCKSSSRAYVHLPGFFGLVIIGQDCVPLWKVWDYIGGLESRRLQAIMAASQR